MPRPSVIPTVKAALEDYLERMQVAFLTQPEEQRTPTLPATPNGKVNVRALAQAIELKQTQEKYLYGATGTHQPDQSGCRRPRQ